MPVVVVVHRLKNFDECEHLDAANALVEKARNIADAVHGTKQVSIPPIY